MSVKTSKRTKTLKRPESIVNNSPRTFMDSDFPVGTTAHQGDLIFVRIASMPTSAKKRNQRQLAEGNTQGSRHILGVGNAFDCNADEVVALIKSVCRKAEVTARYIGPVFTGDCDKADVTHPEHGHHYFRGSMIIATVYQRNVDAEEREQQVRD